MRSKTLFVWLISAVSALTVLLLPQQAQAQINVDLAVDAVCHEDPNTTPNNIIDELGDVLTLTARAAYLDNYCDSIDVGLDTDPDLGVLIPALYPSIIINCPSGLTSDLYEMTWVKTDNQGLTGPNLDSCLIVATLTFHPEGVAVAAGTPLSFGITWFGFANSPPPGGQPTFCADAGYTIAAPCSINSGCAFIQFAEYGGFAFDGIVAIGDSIWLDSALASTMDTMADGDSLVWDAGAVVCDGGVVWLGTDDMVEVQPCFIENEYAGCRADTIFLIRFEWDVAGGEDWSDVLADPATYAVDTFYCVRPIDNLPPEIDIYCVDSCQVFNGNYMDNDTLAGCDDFIRIYLSTTQAAQGKFPINCDGDSVDLTYSYEPNRSDCGQRAPNDDVEWLAVDLSQLVAPGDLFPMNSDSIDLLAKDSLWVSLQFGEGANPGTANDLIWVDIPIDTVHWDSIELCLFTAALNGDSVYVQSIDDAGNLSDSIAWGYEDQTGDSIEGCDCCLDNQPPDLPGSDIYWSYDGVDNYCNQRFSPYDSALATYYTNLTPDSIRWYLSGVDTNNYDPTDELDVLLMVYLIGFDVRTIPDDDPDTPSGAIISRLDYYSPTGAPDSINWELRNPVVPTLEEDACFTWYGKDGPDSLDPDFDFLGDYCPWGMLVGVTEARYMDAAGCNAVLGSDHDGITSILDGYTQLNALYAVVDSCFPTTTMVLDLDTLNGPTLPIGPDYGSVTNPYLWTDGDDNPWLQFKARRFFTQGLLDTCLAEDLCYTIRLDSIYTQGPWPFTDDSIYYDHTDPTTGSHVRTCEPLAFFLNDINTDTVSFEWGMEGPTGDPLPDGLYCLTLELQDNAGNVYRGDQMCIWINGLGPEIDSVAIVNDNLDCNLNFFAGESLCVWIQTDTSAQTVLFDFSCLLNIDSVAPDYDSIWVNTPYSTDGATYKRWYACIMVDLGMIDTVDVLNNDYRIGEWDGDCLDPSDYGIINVKAFDADSNYSQADTLDGTCIIALLGESRCPRLVGPVEFYFFDPDTIFPVGVPDLADSINYLFPGFDVFGVMPDWNAMSPGSVDSSGAYDAINNPAHDQRHDSIFVRLRLDTLSITQWDIVGPDTTYHDTLYLEFRNPNTVENRRRLVTKPLFIPACTNLDGIPPCEDPDNNSIYDGRLELDEHIGGLVEFRYQWNGTWFQYAGTDSQMLVPITGQDTIIVSAWTVDGDSFDIVGTDTIYLSCNSIFADLDVDNDNPDFLEWTGIAAGVRDPVDHSTATVDNLGWDGDCGYRYAEGDTFQIVVHASEQVHYDPAAYPNTDGSDYNAYYGNWYVTGNWQVSIVDSISGQLIDNIGAPGQYVQCELISVTPESLDVDEWAYTLTGRVYNLPPDEYVYNACMVVRGAWDQGANPGRYNEPTFSDAFEWDSFEDTTFCINLIPCDQFVSCPEVYGPDSIMGWIAPEDTNITVCATLIETCELRDCTPGVHADSMRVVEGDFQRITDDPNPWIVPDSVGSWFIYVNAMGDSVGWARMYYWWLRADSSDLATIWCDGDFLDFEIRFASWEGVRDSMTFDACVQVDVNEPRWVDWTLLDSTGSTIDQFDEDYPCVQPDQQITLVGYLTDNGIDCENGIGIGVDTTQVWADLSYLLQNATMDSIAPDSIVIPDMTLLTHGYTGSPVEILDYTTSYAHINEPNGGTILDLNIEINDLEHTYDGDLDILLKSPIGTIVALSSNRGGPDQNFTNTVFDDEAANTIASGSGPFTGSFIPDGDLSDFDGQGINGTWTLIIRDEAGADEGYLYNWTLEITYAPGPFQIAAYWTITPAVEFNCINSIDPLFVFHAGHDLIGHHDRELFLQDTLQFCSDCLPPYIYNAEVYCECDTMLASVDPEASQGTLHYLGTGADVRMVVSIADVDGDSSLGLAYDFMWADLSAIDTNLSWVQGACFWDIPWEAGDTTVVIWGDVSDCAVTCPGNTPIELNAVYNNGETIYVTFALADSAGNVDTVLYAVGIYDSLPPIVDFIYTIGDDSVRAYVTPGDEHVHVYADINGYVNDLVSSPEQVWADFSRFWCDPSMQDAYDTVYAHELVDLGGGNYRAYWGWTPSGSYLVDGDTLSQASDTLGIDPDYSCHLIGAEGTYDSLWIYVNDVACNAGSHFNIFEFSGADTTVPDVDSVWVMGADSCAPGWFDGNSGEWIYVWAWMDSLFNGFEDTLRIDSMMADLSGFGAAYAWTAWTNPDLFGGAPVYGTVPDTSEDVPTYWALETDCDGMTRLVAKWIVKHPENVDCGTIVTVPVKGQRQTGLGGSHGYYLDVEYGTGESFTAEYLSSVAWGDFTIVTGFPGDPDLNGIDSVLVLQNSVYNLDWDSVLTVAVLMDNNCAVSPGDTVFDWSGV